MGMLSEFRSFAIKGNAIDMAVGVIIGGAFGKIVASLVNDVIMPPLGMLLGGVNFSSLFITLSSGSYASLDEAKKAGAATLNYGNFLQTAFDFTIIAFVIFLMVKAINAAKKKEEAAPAEPPKPSEEVLLLRDIRDNLKR
jgi:large conductance mechanosensitive channel